MTTRRRFTRSWSAPPAALPPTAAQRTRRAARARARQAREAAVTRDPVTGQIRRGSVTRVAFGVTLRLPKALPSPNRWKDAHWIHQRRMKAAWVEVIRLAVLDSTMTARPLVLATSPAGAVGWTAPPARARVDITREVVSRARFIRDRDNLEFAGKQLMDSLIVTGFLRDDDEAAIDRHVHQVVSADRRDWTVIAITGPELAADAPLPASVPSTTPDQETTP